MPAIKPPYASANPARQEEICRDTEPKKQREIT